MIGNRSSVNRHFARVRPCIYLKNACSGPSPRLLLPPTSLCLRRQSSDHVTMSRYREKTSTFFIRLAHGLGKKQRSVITPVSKSLGSPAPQTSLSTNSLISSLNRILIYPVLIVFELPDELILSILSHISPDPQLTARYARFCIPYSAGISDCHNKRVEFLRPLSMTCRAMRLRFLPWVWERLELPPVHSWISIGEMLVRKLNVVVNALHTDVFLAASVKYFYSLFSLGRG